MPMRMQEVHPSLVHFPIALTPIAIGADLAGKLTRNERLCAIGRWGIAAAAASGALAGLFGLVAQEEVNGENPEALALLQTHRDLNLSAVAVMTTMAVRRARRERPSLAYLATGLGLVGGLVYSAYLGGKMVYSYGLGVEPADGLYGEVPELTADDAGHAGAVAARDLGKGLVRTAQDLAHGRIVPALWQGDGAGTANGVTQH